MSTKHPARHKKMPTLPTPIGPAAAPDRQTMLKHTLSNQVRTLGVRISSFADLGGRRGARRYVMLGLVCCALPCHGQDPTVHVKRHGETVVIDVDMPVAVAPTVAWAVLSDYDRMATFLSNLTSSKVVERRGDVLHVSQSGRSKVAFMTFSFAAIRAVELVPMREIRSSLISGDFKSYVSTTRLIDLPHGVRVVHHGEYVPKAWLPPIVGVAVIESETRKQFAEFAVEMLKRQAAQK
jgi:ribosome-associated toxin RatA of RatAB toxin-antitoxin module